MGRGPSELIKGGLRAKIAKMAAAADIVERIRGAGALAGQV